MVPQVAAAVACLHYEAPFNICYICCINNIFGIWECTRCQSSKREKNQHKLLLYRTTQQKKWNQAFKREVYEVSKTGPDSQFGA